MTRTRVSRTKPIAMDAGDRDLMPESTFLHIQGRGASPLRMLELPIGPVRIGRGPHCEVRLAEPGLGDVECLLRRRGNTWHYQPVGPVGHVWIDGRVADQQRPLPLGVPFRVGDHWLTLRPADSAANDWELPEEPISVVIEAAPPLEASNADPAANPDRSGPVSASAEEERLRRWHARLEQRERMLKDRQDERRWEARWKSAGESIRARANSPAPTTPTPRTAPTPTPAPAPRSTSRAAQTPPVARIIEPRHSEPLRRAADPSPRPEPPRVPTRPMTEHAVPLRRPAGPPTVRVAIKPARVEITPSRSVEPKVASPITRALVTLPTPQVDWSVARILPVEPVAPIAIEAERETPALPIEPAATVECRVEAEPAPPEVLPAESEVEEVSTPTLPEEVSTSHSRLIEAESIEPFLSEALESIAEPPTAPIEVRSGEPAPVGEISALGMESTTAPEPESARSAEVSPRAVPPAVPEPQDGMTELSEAEPQLGPLGTGSANAEWPSARAIFAAQGKRPHPAQEAPRRSRRRATEPLPTDSTAPAHWSLPRWLGLLPVLLFVLVAGPLGLGLACEWAVESNSANLAMKLALRAEGTPGSTIDVAAIPRGGWWRSTATHLAAWAVALQRAGDGEDHSEDIRSLVDAARHASQLSARSRFVIDPAESPAEPVEAADISHIGRTRDVVTLASTGRRLRKAGKPEASLRAYRSAMEIASKASRDDLEAPSFSEDQQVRRYALPREGLIGLVVVDMAAAGDWTSEQWVEALPPTASASLVASRVLARSHKRVEADRLADLAIRQAADGPPPGYDVAEHRAAGAEALAYRGRWTDAAEQYRLAIDQVDDDLTRRMWWLNLAEVAQRVGDDQARARAIEAAKAPDAADEVTRRALKYQQNLTGLASSGTRRPDQR